MTSSTKPEVHNISQRRHQAELRPQAACVENLVKFEIWFLRLARGQTDRQLVAILRPSIFTGLTCLSASSTNSAWWCADARTAVLRKSTFSITPHYTGGEVISSLTKNEKHKIASRTKASESNLSFRYFRKIDFKNIFLLGHPDHGTVTTKIITGCAVAPALC